MNDKLTQRPTFWIENDKRNEGIGYEAIDHIRDLQAYIETLEAKLRTEQAMSSMEQDAQMLADKLTQREGWLTREEVDRLDEIMASFEWDEDDYALIKSLTEGPHYEKLGKLCRMALYALNGPPAVDLDKVREALEALQRWQPVCNGPTDAGMAEETDGDFIRRSEALATLPPSTHRPQGARMKRYAEVDEAAGMYEKSDGAWVEYADLPKVIRKAREEGASAFCEAVNEEAKAGRSGIGISVEAIVSKLEGGKL